MSPATNTDLAPAVSSGLSSEDQLCLLLARGELTPELRARVLELLVTPLQWAVIMERSCSHQVYPLLYRNLRDLGFQGVPESAQKELKGLYLANALRNQLQAEELSRLLPLFAEAGIRVIPLKGVPLAESLYGDTAGRVSTDIDILVPRASMSQAINLLIASGYRAEVDDPYFSKLALRHGRHFNVVREDRGVSFVLEVHWSLVQHSSKDDEAVANLWAEARPQNFFGAPALALSADWEFLYLCIHAADHDWQNLKWLVDIHQLVLSGGVDWEQMMRKAEQFEIERPIRQTLAVASLLLETPVPTACSPAALPDHLQTFPQAPLPEDSPETTLAFRHLRLLTRPWDKLRYFATVIFAPKPTDRDSVRLPASAGFLYYLIRPFRLAFKWVGRNPQ